MLIFSNRKNVPFEYLLLEWSLVALAYIICLCSGLAVTRLWATDIGSFESIIHWALLAAVPIASIWNYFVGERDTFILKGVLAAWATGIILSVTVHYIYVMYHMYYA
jgi:hypothetical protein